MNVEGRGLIDVHLQSRVQHILFHSIFETQWSLT
jgi:hypothetical protein